MVMMTTTTTAMLMGELDFNMQYLLTATYEPHDTLLANVQRNINKYYTVERNLARYYQPTLITHCYALLTKVYNKFIVLIAYG